MKFSAVINVENIRHPSLLALELQNRRNCILDGLGSASLAKELGHPLENLITAERLERLQILQASQEGTGKFGTIGCLGVGHDQNLAAVTSTGGVGNEVPGRVGDTPSIAGNYCNKVAAVSCTGIGEQIQAMGLAHGLCLRIEDGMSFKSAVQKTADEASARDFELAFIAASWNSNQQQVEWAAVEINSKLLWLAMSSQGLVEVCAP